MTDQPDNVIRLSPRPTKILRDKMRVYNVATASPSFTERLAAATMSDGWIDLVALCSRYVVDAIGRDGYTQETLKTLAALINTELCAHDVNAAVRFTVVTVEAVRIDVFVRAGKGV